MAGSTPPRPEKEFLACSRCAIGWRLCSGLLLRRQPRRKGIWRIDDRSKAHMGMLYAAEFGACSTVRTHFIRLKPHVVVMAWNHIGLACEFWDPETVNDVARFEVKLDGGANGHLELVSRDNVFMHIVKLPPPLVRYHPHLNVAPSGLLQV